MSLIETFLARADARPDAHAIVTGAGQTRSFGQLARNSAALAAHFTTRGIGSGDRVLVARGMSVALYETLLALWHIGAVAVFPEPAAGLAGVAHAVRAAKPRSVAAGGALALLARVHPAFGGLPVLAHDLSQMPRSGTPTIAGDAPALITFTSGSTGRPKGIIRSVDFLLLQHRLLEHLRRTTPDDVDLISLPVFVLSNLAEGAVSVFPDGKITAPAKLDGARLASQVAAYRVNRIVAPPAVVRRLCADKHAALSELTAIFTGGGPVFPNLLHRAHEAAPNAAIHAVYGSTEAEPIAHIAYDEISAEDWQAMAAGAGLLAGRPIDDITVRLREGEVQVSGAHVNKGYLDASDNAATKIQEDGTVWHRTGDAARLDSRGRLWLLGRHSAASGDLYPFAVETAALSWPGVDGAALLARDGAAALLAVSGTVLDVENLQARASALGDVVVRPVPAIPLDKRHNSKVDYVALRKLLT